MLLQIRLNFYLEADQIDVMGLHAASCLNQVKADIGTRIQEFDTSQVAHAGGVKVNFSAIEKHDVAVILQTVEPLDSSGSHERSFFMNEQTRSGAVILGKYEDQVPFTDQIKAIPGFTLQKGWIFGLFKQLAQLAVLCLQSLNVLLNDFIVAMQAP
jgi:hypothetical protein